MLLHKLIQTTRLCSLCLLGWSTSAATDVETERNRIREWIQVEKEISREQAAWASERQILQDRIALLRVERDRLENQIKEAVEGVSELDLQRMRIQEQREELRAVTAAMLHVLREFELMLLELYPQLPGPLKEETVRLFQRIPTDPEATRLTVAERLQAVVGLLNFADRFNTGVQREVEIREVDGRQLEVETLYFGLAGAFFSDASGQFAGTGHPGNDGWEWISRPESATAIARMIAVFRGTREASFQSVPVEIR